MSAVHISGQVPYISEAQLTRPSLLDTGARDAVINSVISCAQIAGEDFDFDDAMALSTEGLLEKQREFEAMIFGGL
jgi:hypothetical protein